MIETYADSGVNVSDVEDFTSVDGWFQLYRGCRSFIVCGFYAGNMRSIRFYFISYIYIYIFVEFVLFEPLSNVIAKEIRTSLILKFLYKRVKNNFQFILYSSMLE